MIIATLCYLIREGPNGLQVLLPMKKEGIGKGFYNGVGGKVEKGESITSAAVREIQEEVAVLVKPKDLEKVAVEIFHFINPSRESWKVHAFLVKAWKGEPVETREMRPQWFHFPEIPFDSMWADDKICLERILKIPDGEILKGEFTFSGENEIVSFKLQPKKVRRINPCGTSIS